MRSPNVRKEERFSIPHSFSPVSNDPSRNAGKLDALVSHHEGDVNTGPEAIGMVLHRYPRLSSPPLISSPFTKNGPLQRTKWKTGVLEEQSLNRNRSGALWEKKKLNIHANHNTTNKLQCQQENGRCWGIFSIPYFFILVLMTLLEKPGSQTLSYVTTRVMLTQGQRLGMVLHRYPRSSSPPGISSPFTKSESSEVWNGKNRGN